MDRHPDFAEFERLGAHFSGAMAFAEPAWRENLQLAMDAQPALASVPNTGIPSWFTTIVDPEIYRVIFAPNTGAKILGERKKGSWLDETAMFPFNETTGEVSTYGDYSNNGSIGLNVNYPQRQSYHFQTILQYGEREAERQERAHIAWVAEIQRSSVDVLNKYGNLTYHFGVGGLANYGLLNEPALSAALTPGPKAAGGVQWVKNGFVNATPNEILLDVQALFIQIVSQNNGAVKLDDPLVLVVSPVSQIALTAVNTYNVDVFDMLKKNYPKIRLEVDPLYGAQTTSNPQGNSAGNVVQLIAERVEGQEAGYCAFTEKYRTHALIRALSSFMQKVTQGSWGFIYRQSTTIAQMVGV